MNSQQSGMMMACGLLALMILCMFSICISVFIFAIFGLQESSLGPLTLASMVGLIGLLVYASHRDDKQYHQKREQWRLEDEIQSRKRELIDKATDFDDSRKNIAKRVKQAQIKHDMEARIKALRLNDEDDHESDCCYDVDLPDYMSN
jgi:hypothetical protein